jgi:hypothetical protein
MSKVHTFVLYCYVVKSNVVQFSNLPAGLFSFHVFSLNGSVNIEIK